MPVFIKDYKWQQTDKYISIQVPLKGVHKKHVDILTTKRYIKAHYYPYIFELFLSQVIDDTNSNCFIKDEEVVFELCKVNPEHWDKLELEIEKSEKLELKKKYLNEIHEEAERRDKLKSEKKSELKRLAVREQISLDTQFRERIENIKKEETQKALTEIKIWENVELPEKNVKCKAPLKSLRASEASVTKYVPSKKNINTPPSSVPLPRKSQAVNVSFTTREFPTPSRESKAQEEQEWLTKQAEARRSAGFDDGDLRPDERNPQWLKEKGDEFFKAKNYLAALSAYTTGIKLSKNLVSLYVNRSAAHFAVGNLHKTIDDCSTALELMTPICKANREARAKCLARRGAALCQLGLLKEGAGEIEAAIKLTPTNDTLKKDLENIQLSIKNESS